MEKPKPYTPATIEEMSKEEAEAFLELLWNSDETALIELSKELHPGITLVELSKKAMCLPSGKDGKPSEQELVLLATNFQLSRRMIDVACHVAMDSTIEQFFRHIADEILASKIRQKEENEAFAIQALMNAKAKEKLSN